MPDPPPLVQRSSVAIRSAWQRYRELPEIDRWKERKVPDRYWSFMAGMVLGIAATSGNKLYRCRRAGRERHYDTGFHPDRCATVDRWKTAA